MILLSSANSWDLKSSLTIATMEPQPVFVKALLNVAKPKKKLERSLLNQISISF